MTDQPTTGRLAAIRARLDAASAQTTVDVHAGGSTLRATATGGDRGFFLKDFGDLVAATVGDMGPLKVTVADDEDGQDATLTLHARDDLSFLLSLVDILQGRLDTAEGLVADMFDSGNCWFDHHGYCQEHGWFETEPACPHGRAKALGLDGSGVAQ